MIFYAKTCLECFKLLHYRKEVNMTYWKVTDNLPKRTANLTPNYWKCITFLNFYLSLLGWIWKSYLLIWVRWNLHFQIGLNEKKKKKKKNDSKIAVQFFHTSLLQVSSNNNFFSIFDLKIKVFLMKWLLNYLVCCSIPSIELV